MAGQGRFADVGERVRLTADVDQMLTAADDGIMRKPRASFNDIVAAVKSETKPDVPVKQEPGKVLIAPDGTVFRNADRLLEEVEASRLMSTGAWVAIDDCGCGGYCTVEWLSPTDSSRRMPKVRKAKKDQQPFASVEEWRSGDESSMLFFSGPDFKWD